MKHIGFFSWRNCVILRLMNTKSHRIIVVDDDPELRALVKRFLTEHGFETRAVDGGAALERELTRNPPDAIVLDLMMPGEDGLAVCRRLRVICVD